MRLTAWLPRLFGRQVLAPFQNGLIQFYAAVTALGVAGLLWYLLADVIGRDGDEDLRWRRCW